MHCLIHDPEGFEKPFGSGGYKATLTQFAQQIGDADRPRRGKAVVGHEISQGTLDLDSQLDDGYERKSTCELLGGRQLLLKLRR